MYVYMNECKEKNIIICMYVIPTLRVRVPLKEVQRRGNPREVRLPERDEDGRRPQRRAGPRGGRRRRTRAELRRGLPGADPQR
jgi:hypothetical protein